MKFSKNTQVRSKVSALSAMAPLKAGGLWVSGRPEEIFKKISFSLDKTPNHQGLNLGPNRLLGLINAFQHLGV